MSRIGTMLVVATLMLAGVACSTDTPREEPSVTATQSMTVTSSAFGDGQPIPTEFTCDGPGRVPDLTWQGTPADAGALAVVVDDPDAPSGTFTHWVVLDLPADTRGLAGGSLPSGATQAVNSGGREGYYPPCPPSGTHHYRFTVYALTRATGLNNGVDLDTALRAVQANAMGQGRLVGTYARGR